MCLCCLLVSDGGGLFRADHNAETNMIQNRAVGRRVDPRTLLLLLLLSIYMYVQRCW